MERALSALQAGSTFTGGFGRRASLAVLAALLALAAAAALLAGGGSGQAGSSPIAEGYGPDYWVVPSGAIVRAGSPVQGLSERFADGGLSLRGHGASLRLGTPTLAGGALAFGRASTSLNRVEYAAPGVREWFANKPAGIEQGFTVSAAAATGGQVVLNVPVSGAVAKLGAGGVVLRSGAGKPIFYRDLRAVDARGRVLPAHLAVGAAGISLVVDTSRASFPVRIDPTVTTFPEADSAKFTIPESGRSEVGTSVAISRDGQTAVVGAPQSAVLPGAAWILYRAGGKWRQGPLLAPLTAEEATCEGSAENESKQPECGFGSAVAISQDGDVAAVGSPLGHELRGEVAIYEREGAAPGWRRVSTVAAPTMTKRIERFGRSVALSADGTTLAVGAPAAENFRGAAWVFKAVGGNPESGYLPVGSSALVGNASEQEGMGRFGRAIAISGSGETVVVGAPVASTTAGPSSGQAYVFQYSSEAGEYAAQGEPLVGGSEEEGEGHFGFSVAISGDGSTILVGARADLDGRGERTGSAFVFANGGSGWTQQGAKLVARSDGGEGSIEPGGHFGYSVALSEDGSTALVGAPQNDVTGSAWIFSRSGETWTQGQELQPTEFVGSQVRFGESVALAADGSAALVGGPNDTNIEKAAYGAVWTYATAQAVQEEREAEEGLTRAEREAKEKREQEIAEHRKLEEERLAKEKAELERRAKEKGQVLGQKEENPLPKAGFFSIAQIVKGGVFIESPPGSGKFRELKEGEKITNGAVIDATKGKVTLKLEGAGGKIETITLYGARFRFNQKTNGQTTFTLVGGNTKQCKKSRKAVVDPDHDGDNDAFASKADVTAQTARRRLIRRLWASGHGSFKTHGSYASGAVLGTEWVTSDYCEGTEIRVIRSIGESPSADKVLVTNYRTHRTHVLHAGHSIFIRR